MTKDKCNLSSPLDTAALQYVWECPGIVALLVDDGLCVVDANPYACVFLRPGVVGRSLQDIILHASRGMELKNCIQENDGVCSLTVDTASSMPETLLFRFLRLSDGRVLAIGSLDAKEQQALRNEILSLNGELANITRQLHQANAELRVLNELKDRFVGMAAHDLRRPVSVMMTYGGFLMDEVGNILSEEQQGFVRALQRAAADMKHLIDNFLDLAVVQSGQLRLEYATVQWKDILDGVLSLMRLVAEKKQVKLVLDICEDCYLCVDPAKIGQVVANLLSNAIEHSPVGGHVWLKACSDNDKAILCVRDDGAGIDPEVQSRIFEPYLRAGTRKTAGERSCGLGLVIVRLIVSAHGGTISVDSVVGQGASFLVALPQVAN